MKTSLHCATCGGENVHVEANVGWNRSTQAFEVEAVLDKGHWCDDCEDNCAISRFPIKGVVPDGPYFAHHVTAIVQTPGDSEQTTCIVITTSDAKTFQKTGCPGGLMAYVPSDDSIVDAQGLADRFAAVPDLFKALKATLDVADSHWDPRTTSDPCATARALLKRFGIVS